MTDHVYEMSALNQNIGYNQPTHTVYYLGSDYASDEEIWAAYGEVSAVEEIRITDATSDGIYYDLTGRRIVNPGPGLYILDGRKVLIKQLGSIS